MKKTNSAIYIPNMDAKEFDKICVEKGLQFIYTQVQPHGRLIDADELRELYEEWENDKEAGIDIDKCHVPIPVIRQNIDDAPTVLEAKQGET